MSLERIEERLTTVLGLDPHALSRVGLEDLAFEIGFFPHKCRVLLREVLEHLTELDGVAGSEGQFVALGRQFGL